jgi:hypothetical protein
MPCACDKCLHHCRTLGLAPKPPSKIAIRKAFRAEAKRWHPDRFERDPVKRLDAEEHFKGIQVAYRELWEHCESPEELPIERPATKAPVKKEEPAIFFGGAPGCYAPPNLPLRAEEIIVDLLYEKERVLGFLDLSGRGSRRRKFFQFMLLTSDRTFVRDSLNIISMIWHTDLGNVNLIDQHRHGKPDIWQRIVEYISGTEKRYLLQIYRSNGSHFFSITSQADDSVKKVIYNFLLQKKSKPRS